MAQDLPKEAREPEDASDGAVVVAGWMAVDSEQGENAYALTAVPRLLINWV